MHSRCSRTSRRARGLFCLVSSSDYPSQWPSSGNASRCDGLAPVSALVSRPNAKLGERASPDELFGIAGAVPCEAIADNDLAPGNAGNEPIMLRGPKKLRGRKLGREFERTRGLAQRIGRRIGGKRHRRKRSGLIGHVMSSQLSRRANAAPNALSPVGLATAGHEAMMRRA